jgi:beta-lactamase class A
MRIVFFLLLTCVTAIGFSQKHDRVLQKKIEALAKGFKGDVGIYVRNLKTGKVASINADTLFPTASMIKIPITIRVFLKIESGELDYHSELVYRDSLLYEGEDILGSFKDGETIALSKLLMLMLSTSDNTASLWCQGIAGGGVAINDWLAKNGFFATRVNSRTPGRELARERFGWGQTTPREMAELLVRIRHNKVISSRASERIYRNLARNYWDANAISQIPPDILVASKNGAVDASRSEVVLVHAPHGEYVFCLITKNQVDQSWMKQNEGWVLIRNLSEMLWHYHEPKSRWQPAPGSEEWR